MGRHKEWRRLAKKLRRKRIRSAAAAERDEVEKQRLEKISSTPYYKAWLAEQEALEMFREQEERQASILAHEKWVYLETLAQERWIRKQKLLVEEEAKRKEQEALIKREWEKEQEKERLEKEAKEAEENRKKLQYERLMEQLDSFIDGRGAKPAALYTSCETNPGREPCPFFSKVGACRFRDSCTRNHLRPGISTVILIPGFYSHFSLEIGVQGEYDTDIHLEFDQSERSRHFKEFFEDVTPELEKFGPIFQFRVCSNTDPHLRGNVYVAYKSERAAAAAYKALNGRYYAGRMLSVEFVSIPSWKNAICGLQFRGSCPKGSKCNFLHVFRNPNNLYSSWDKPISEQRGHHRTPERDDWRWTPSPPVVSSQHDEDEDDRYAKSAKRKRDREKRNSGSRAGEQRKRKRSREPKNRSDGRKCSRDRLSTPSDKEERSGDRRSVPSDRRERSADRRSTPSDRRERSTDRRSTPSDRRERSTDRRSTPSDRRERSTDRHSTPSDRRERSRDKLSTPSKRRNRSRDGLSTPSDRVYQSRDGPSSPSNQRSKDRQGTGPKDRQQINSTEED